MLAVLGIVGGEEAELDNTPLYGDKIVGPAIYQFQEADQLTGFAFGAAILALIALIEFTNINIGWETVEQKVARDPDNKTGSQLAPGYVNGDLGTLSFCAVKYSSYINCPVIQPSFIYSYQLLSFDPL
jgi:hypothetical protein